MELLFFKPNITLSIKSCKYIFPFASFLSHVIIMFIHHIINNFGLRSNLRISILIDFVLVLIIINAEITDKIEKKK